MKKITFLRIVFLSGCIFFSCSKDYLNKSPLVALDEQAYANKRGVEGLLIGAYSLLDGVGSTSVNYNDNTIFGSSGSNWIYGSVCGTEAYKGSEPLDQFEVTMMEKFVSTPNSTYLSSKWALIYDGIQRANDVLRILPKAKDILREDSSRISGEARFLRGYFHFEGKKFWNNIPYVDESISYANHNYTIGNETDIWPDIENDLQFAVDNLKETPYKGSVGRATKFTAMALLAKVYMFQPQKMALAKLLLEAVIGSGKFQLVNYGDNFNPEKKNGPECIFSVQMSVNDGAEGANGNFGDVLNFPMGGGPGQCCGFFQPSQFLVNHFKTISSSGLPDLDHFNEADIKNDEFVSIAEPFTPYQGTLDPRLDWTVGRRGIPYLDWGIHPGSDLFYFGGWVRDRTYGGPYNAKKNVYYQSQQGRLTDAQFWGNLTTANNINLIRYADVLLWAAEVEAEIGDLDVARGYVNQVRRRAADPSGWVKNSDGTPAANYMVGEYTNPWPNREYARKAVRFERMLELGMEGHRFFDLVRWGIADQEITTYLNKESTLRRYLQDAVFTKGKSEYFPIPQKQIDLSAGPDGIPKLKQNPGYN